MPVPPTDKYGIARMDGNDPGSTIDDQHNAAMNTVDANMAGWASGTLDARPPAGKAGLFYRASDGPLAVDSGSAWEIIARGVPSGLVGRQVLDVGVLGQTRAGRALTVADFTSLGLVQPYGLWNLGDLSNLGSDGRALTNKGAVPFGKGITGAAGEAAVFAGSSTQALYITDAGGTVDPFRLSSGGSWGCWFRTAKSGDQGVMGRWRDGGFYGYLLHVQPSNAVAVYWSPDGVNPFNLSSVSRVADDRWHFVVATHEGGSVRLYVDGALEAIAAATGMPFGAAVPLNIGGYGGDAATATTFPFYGRVDEAFVSSEVLSEDQVRALYAIKLPHGLGSQPGGARVNVYRRRRGAAFAVADFPASPLRLYNFNGGSYGDAGSNQAGLSGNFGGGFIVDAPGVDGTRGGAQVMGGAHTGIQATDAGLPSGTNARSYGLWFKTATVSPSSMGLISYGTMPSSRDVLFVNNGGIYQVTASDQVGGSPVTDGAWHFAVVVIDNAAADGLRRKVYVDGALVASSTVLGAIVLGGKFRIGSDVDASMMPLVGSVDGIFVTNYALARDDVMRLYARGAQQLAASPKNDGDHVEAMDATSVYFIGDTLEPQHLVDVGVAA